MDNVIDFPKKHKEVSNLVYLNNFLREKVIYLQQKKQELEAIKKDLLDIQRRSRLRLVKCDGNPGNNKE